MKETSFSSPGVKRLYQENKLSLFPSIFRLLCIPFAWVYSKISCLDKSWTLLTKILIEFVGHKIVEVPIFQQKWKTVKLTFSHTSGNCAEFKNTAYMQLIIPNITVHHNVTESAYRWPLLLFLVLELCPKNHEITS